jgi:hypothetical protein
MADHHVELRRAALVPSRIVRFGPLAAAVPSNWNLRFTPKAAAALADRRVRFGP